MALRFKNNYEREIWAMVERYQPNCSASSNWRKEGWWRIGPGETAVVYGGDAKAVNPIWYCYAYAGDGTEWRDKYQETVPHSVFEWCSNVSDASSRTILMREFTVTAPNFTFNFNP
ncbi:DUF1036 domain-containing protein [Streptomyces hirsutus]|uniref:DUF1036 domain-containing protein n=1 Tax=Streptomyces hirsutus TaxID=35620 RepID=UPI0006E18298|nr:DUF1036 domain-containing protein [Streptomyces hirsutus]